ncbi:MAG: hypothetical protein V2B15_03575 [Bacteroidota bacterium]
MDENLGYIMLHRKLLNSQVFANPVKLKVWIWCLLKANFKSKYVSLKISNSYTEVKILRGQFIFGRNRSADELNMKGSTVWSFLKGFERTKMLEIKSNNHYSIVTVCNYEDYQKASVISLTTNQQPINNQTNTKPTPADTTNNDKKDKNEKEGVEYQEFLGTFNALTKKKYTGDDRSRGQFMELKNRGYNKDDIEKAIRNCLIDSWHIDNPNVLTPGFISKIEQFEKYLNASGSDNDKPENLNKMVY